MGLAHACPNYIKAVLFTSATLTDRVKLPNQCRSKKTSEGAERDRAQRAAETVDQRSERLRKLRVRDCAKHATQTASERQATLQQKSMQKKGNETSEERETRLQRKTWKREITERETENYSRQGTTTTQS